MSAEKISDIIILHLELLKKNPLKSIITDTTAGVGGDTISFSFKFKHIYAIEINKTRAEYLNNNINVYDLHNVTIFNDNCMDIVKYIDDHDVVFIDPPWETPESGSYKKYDKLKLQFAGDSLENICNTMMSDEMKKVPSLIVLKLPKNYDIVYFYNNIKNKKIYYYDLHKMIILVIVNVVTP